MTVLCTLTRYVTHTGHWLARNSCQAQAQKKLQKRGAKSSKKNAISVTLYAKQISRLCAKY